MGLKVDLTGERFGRLTVNHVAGKSKNRHTIWNCSCTCGKTLEILSTNLINGKQSSCGCAKGEGNITHGASKTPTYKTWCEVVERTTNPHSSKYKNYGARGVTMCQRWRESFEAFLEDMGERPQGTSIDRINNSGNYEPGNCRWATPQEQAFNRRSNVILTLNGVSKTTLEWERETGIKARIITSRVRRGWSTERILSTPAKQPKKAK